MIGKVIDLNNTDAFLSFPDGTTMDIGLPHLPKGVKIGDSIDVQLGNSQMTNDKLNILF